MPSFLGFFSLSRLPLILLICSSIICAPSSFAQTQKQALQKTPSSPKSEDQDKRQRLKKWQEKMSSQGDLSVHWTQVQYKALRKRSTTTQGKGYFSKPHYFLWDMTSKNQAWLFTGNQLIHMDRNTQKAMKYRATAGQGREFLRFIALITQFDDLTREYHIAQVSEDPTHLKLTLRPKLAGELTEVRVNYLKKDAVIERIRMDFSGGNHTTLTFSQHRRSAIKTSFFTTPKDLKHIQVP
ncbi:MAG: outer membrane lipoprotein carrier protein LolA [Proteobacteria bacterium]|nr:outer membrane lipoprotein carrier protein LolA [Pseudomonadota bacterium]